MASSERNNLELRICLAWTTLASTDRLHHTIHHRTTPTTDSCFTKRERSTRSVLSTPTCQTFTVLSSSCGESLQPPKPCAMVALQRMRQSTAVIKHWSKLTREESLFPKGPHRSPIARWTSVKEVASSGLLAGGCFASAHVAFHMCATLLPPENTALYHSAFLVLVSFGCTLLSVIGPSPVAPNEE